MQGNSSESAALAEAQALVRSEAGGAVTTPTIPTETDDQIADRLSAAMGVPREMLQHTISDHLVWVLDQVHVPGVLVAAEGTTLPEMIEAAGGALTQADLSSVEVTSTEFDRNAGMSHTTRNSYVTSDDSFRTVSIRPLDVIRLRQVYADRTGETITIAGQVRYPGVFDITRDERLSSVLQRAGGMTEVAFPYGAIFTRRSAAIHEQEGNNRSARELESQLAVLAAAPTENPQSQANSVSYLTSLVDAVRNEPVLGRVTVTADPVVLAARPDLDVILEPGDSVYIPKRPSSVTVSGEVLNPGSFQFRPNLSFEDYVRLAGGPTQSAYESDIFIILPDGSATPTGDNWLSYGNGGHIPPGSTIIVPRDLRPFDWGQFLKDATQIVSQLAIAGASLAVLQRN
jgi:polysaccharide biosynthesis/export protein